MTLQNYNNETRWSNVWLSGGPLRQLWCSSLQPMLYSQRNSPKIRGFSLTRSLIFGFSIYTLIMGPSPKSNKNQAVQHQEMRIYDFSDSNVCGPTIAGRLMHYKNIIFHWKYLSIKEIFLILGYVCFDKKYFL